MYSTEAACLPAGPQTGIDDRLLQATFWMVLLPEESTHPSIHPPQGGGGGEWGREQKRSSTKDEDDSLSFPPFRSCWSGKKERTKERTLPYSVRHGPNSNSSSSSRGRKKQATSPLPHCPSSFIRPKFALLSSVCSENPSLPCRFPATNYRRELKVPIQLQCNPTPPPSREGRDPDGA